MSLGWCLITAARSLDSEPAFLNGQDHSVVRPDLQATLPDSNAGPGDGFLSPRERSWRLWDCPDHVDRLAGLREFGGQRHTGYPT
jgi:hypothetical protein